MNVSKLVKVMWMVLIAMSVSVGAAHATTYWPNGPYACTWTKGTASGVSLVTFAISGDDLVRSGSMTTVYPSGPPSTVGVTLWLHFITDENKFELLTSAGVRCQIESLNNGRVVTFWGCSNGAVQNCVR